MNGNEEIAVVVDADEMEERWRKEEESRGGEIKGRNEKEAEAEAEEEVFGGRKNRGVGNGSREGPALGNIVVEGVDQGGEEKEGMDGGVRTPESSRSVDNNDNPQLLQLQVGSTQKITSSTGSLYSQISNVRGSDVSDFGGFGSTLFPGNGQSVEEGTREREMRRGMSSHWADEDGQEGGMSGKSSLDESLHHRQSGFKGHHLRDFAEESEEDSVRGSAESFIEHIRSWYIKQQQMREAFEGKASISSQGSSGFNMGIEEEAYGIEEEKEWEGLNEGGGRNYEEGRNESGDDRKAGLSAPKRSIFGALQDKLRPHRKSTVHPATGAGHGRRKVTTRHFRRERGVNEKSQEQLNNDALNSFFHIRSLSRDMNSAHLYSSLSDIDAHSRKSFKKSVNGSATLVGICGEREWREAFYVYHISEKS
eukprot:Nk52_evm10s225 gene=Nk52_evmTU10s225